MTRALTMPPALTHGTDPPHAADATSAIAIRPIRPTDFAQWQPLWAGYNAFYGREGATALADEISRATWDRFFAADEPVFALVAEEHGRLLGLTHYLFHRSTTRVEPVCYLQDLFTLPPARGRGVGRALIHGVYAAAQAQGSRRVYWHTHATNTTARRLYDAVAAHHGFVVYTHEATAP